MTQLFSEPIDTSNVNCLLEKYSLRRTITPPSSDITLVVKEDRMDRRAFMKTTGAAVLLAPLLMKETLAAREQSLVAVAEGTDYAAITRKAINAVGGDMNHFIPCIHPDSAPSAYFVMN